MQDEIHIKDYINVIKNRRIVVILFLATTVAIVTLGSFIMKPVYRATATIFIDKQSPNVLAASGIVALESENYYSYKDYYKSQREVITSRVIAQKVFTEFNLKDSKKYVKAKDPIKEFLRNVKVESVRETRLLKLHVDDNSPVLAAKIANRIADIYVKRNLYYISREELMNLMKNEYLKLETRLSEYSKVYKHKHPKVLRLKEVINELVGKIENVKETNFNYEIIQEELEGEPQYALEGLKANNISVMDPAEVPKLPLMPKKLLNIIISIVVGLFGGIAIAFFLEYLDDTVRSIEDLEKLSGWPYLGGVPTIENIGKTKERERYLLTHVEAKDPVAEAYRAIRSSILFSSTEEHPLRSMLITSPGPQEGKTTVVCNLGIVLAQRGKKVLLVDADMRKPRLHEVFDASNKNGLSEYLCGQIQFESAIKKTDIDGLSFVNSGEYPPNPSELLSSHKLKEFIETAKKSFDFVIFDTPPTAIVTDAVVLSQATDGVIMAVENGKTSKRVLPRIFKLLTDARARVIGTVFNKMSLRSGNYYYYSRYYGKKT